MGHVIRLSDVITIGSPSDYKIHFAKWNGSDQPLDVFTRSADQWKAWQEHRGKKDDFNRPYIFSFARYYHEPDEWLFGGIFEVTERLPTEYKVNLTNQAQGFIGRLKLSAPYNGRNVRVNLEAHWNNLIVSEVLREPFAGRAFPGFEDVELSFEELEVLVRNDRADWKSPLESVKGVYLITDDKTGRYYVGSAYGALGIWSRWKQYVETGHGGNVALKEHLAKLPSIDYCRSHFRFALLEYRAKRTSDEVILARETFWKNLLFTKQFKNFNRN
jgi:hypothetical protein